MFLLASKTMDVTTEEGDAPDAAPLRGAAAGFDAIAAALGIAFLVGLALLGRGGPGRVFELVLVGVLALVSYRVGWRAARATAGGAAVAFLVLEEHYGRLGGGHLARELIATLLVCA